MMMGISIYTLYGLHPPSLPPALSPAEPRAPPFVFIVVKGAKRRKAAATWLHRAGCRRERPASCHGTIHRQAGRQTSRVSPGRTLGLLLELRSGGRRTLAGSIAVITPPSPGRRAVPAGWPRCGGGWGRQTGPPRTCASTDTQTDRQAGPISQPNQPLTTSQSRQEGETGTCIGQFCLSAACLLAL